MARPNVFSTVSAGALLLSLGAFAAACNGHVISLGDTGDTLQPLTGGTTAAAATPIACPSGWAHPNICCTATENASPACGAWEESPFRACAAGTTTYPDPLSCCSLSDPKNCSDSPSAPVVTPPPSWGCGYACPPGWWEQATGSTPPGVTLGSSMCCEARPGEVPLCVPVSNGATLSTPPTGCGTVGSGGTLDADAGDEAGVPVEAAEDAGCSTTTTPVDPDYDGGAASLCGACPTGWTADPLQPEVCCETASDGTQLCFSQASGSATTIPDDGGTTEVIDASTNPSSGWGSGGEGPDGAPAVSCSGSDSTCSCNNTVNGHTYELDCTAAKPDGTATCSCLVDGVSVGSTTVDSCQDSTGVPNAYAASNGCGFP
jgi:hypothetical protein